MKFDRALFNSICASYGVEFSEEYDRPMLREADGSIHSLEEEDMKRMFSPRVSNIPLKCVFESSDIPVIAC